MTSRSAKTEEDRALSIKHKQRALLGAEAHGSRSADSIKSRSWTFENFSERRMSESAEANQQGRVSLEDFTLIKVIGKGTYGKVMLVRHKKVGISV